MSPDSTFLGRIPSEPDERNWPLAAFLDGPASPLDVALAAVLQQHHTNAFKTWARLITAAVQGQTPAPPAPAPSQGVTWPDVEQLDQGQTGHCVGFGWSQFLNTQGTEQIDDHYTNADGHDVYYECKVIDGEPKAENGSSVHSGARAVKARGRISAYAWANSLAEIKQWLLTKGPVCVGTDWTNDMFNPDAQGVIHPTGNVAGGHCYILVGYDPATDLLELQNSWGDWGINGRAYIPAAEFEMLAATNGECCTSVELAK